MLNILIAESEPVDQKRCFDLIKQLLPNARIHSAQSGEEALRVLKETDIDLAFIDKDLPDIDGFRLATKIMECEQHYMLSLILTMKEDDLVLADGVRFAPHQALITKPYSDEEFIEKVDRILKGIRAIKSRIIDGAESEECKVKIESHSGSHIVAISDIYYAEAIGHTIKLYTKNENITDIRMSLKELVELINDDAFIFCHRAFALNVENVIHYQPREDNRHVIDIFFDTDQKIRCLVSRNHSKTVRAKISQNL